MPASRLLIEASNKLDARIAAMGTDANGLTGPNIEPLFVGLPASAPESDDFIEHVLHSTYERVADGMNPHEAMKGAVTMALIVGMLAGLEGDE